MAVKTIKRRVHHGDVDEPKKDYMETSGSDTINEALLRKNGGNASSSEGGSGHKPLLDIPGNKTQEPICWAHLFSHLITRCSHWIANFFTTSREFLGRLFTLPSTSQNKFNDETVPMLLNSLQEERLMNLRQRLEVPFDGTRLDHQDALKQLWGLAYPHRELPPLKSELWKDMGWQGPDPSTDFRSGGFISLENLIFFAENYPESFHRLLHKLDGKRSEWEYPFAAAGVNLSFMLTQMLGLKSGPPMSRTGAQFLELLGAEELAFDNLYCVAFQLFDSKWISMRASYMEFNEVLKSTRTQLEHELRLKNISRVEDLPSFRMLNR